MGVAGFTLNPEPSTQLPKPVTDNRKPRPSFRVYRVLGLGFRVKGSRSLEGFRGLVCGGFRGSSEGFAASGFRAEVGVYEKASEDCCGFRVLRDPRFRV